MPFDPHRDVSVVSGPFSVDVNELCAEHTILTYKKLLIIEPARGALTTALWEAEAATPANPLAGTALVDAIRRALAALDALESHIDELLWKLQDASLIYGRVAVGGRPRQPDGTATHPDRRGQVLCHGRPRGRRVERPLSWAAGRGT